jgi:hypothetical protein
MACSLPFLRLAFPHRVALRHRRHIGRQGPDDSTAHTRHVVVDKGIYHVQRKTHLVPSGDTISPRRQLKPRMKSGARQSQGGKCDERVQRSDAHDLERVDGRSDSGATFFPHLGGRNDLLHEDNQAVCYTIAGLTSRSPAMTAELRKLWHLLDANGINELDQHHNLLSDRRRKFGHTY